VLLEKTVRNTRIQLGGRNQGFECHTVLKEINQPLGGANRHSSTVILEEGDLLFDFEMFGEL